MHEQRTVCRVLTDGELEQSVSQHANQGSASFSKGKPTSRYTFIPKSDSPGPIYDIRTTLGEDCPPLYGMAHVQSMWSLLHSCPCSLDLSTNPAFMLLSLLAAEILFVPGLLCTVLAGV